MKTRRWPKMVATVSSLGLLMIASPAWAPPEKCGTPVLSAPAFAKGSVNTLTWDAPSPATDKGYQLEVASTPDLVDGRLFKIEQLFPNLPATPTSLEVTGLSEGVHYYHVRAMSGGCLVSEWSEVVATLQDATVPTVSVAADRAPDFGDWYTAPVSIEWSGADSAGGSGLASCDSLLYSGPDVASNTVSGKCVDNAGNEASASLTFSYDATDPAIEFSTDDGHIFLNEPITISGTLIDLSPSSVSISMTNTTAGVGSLIEPPAPISVSAEGGAWSVTFIDAAPGTYLVTATGLDSSGHSVTASIQITILSGPVG